MKKRAREKITFWQDQKDEITLTFLGGLMFLVWDDEIIAGYDMLFVSGKLESHELQPFMYLMVGPAVERIVWAYKKLKGGSKNGGQG